MITQSPGAVRKEYAITPAGGSSSPDVVTVDRLPEHENGLHYSVASNVRDIIDAWGVLYRAYIRAGYIPQNPHRLHTVPQAIGPQTLVVIARIGGVAVSTISGILDTAAGLPLDDVYHAELNGLRNQGRKLIEIGLFGDRREDSLRSFNAQLETIRLVVHFGLHNGVDDFLCGIPPKRARLYHRMFAFEPVGEIKPYGTVEGNEVQLLRVTARTVYEDHARYRGLDYFMREPIDASIFERRFRFDSELVEACALGSFRRKQ